MTDLKNIMILLLGFPGTGKRTTAVELCTRCSDFKLIDNQTINRPIFKILDLDGKTPITPEAWKMVDRVRDIVFEALVEVARPEANFVFTFYAADESEKDHQIYNQFFETSRKRGATFIPVRMIINEAENKNRIVSPDRVALMKDTNVENTTRRHANETVLYTGHDNEITIDVTDLSAGDVAVNILEHVQNVVRENG